MAVKFPLKMAGGTMVRTIEELREHFDLTAALAYYKDGRLEKWLENGYYDEEARKVAALDTASDSIAVELCAILGVSYAVNELEQANLGDITQKHERLERLKQYTVDDAVLAAVDRVAFTQEDLDALVSKRSFTTSRSVSGSIFTTAASSWSSTFAGSNNIDPRTVIYLCGEHFTIPGDAGGITYVGINNPTVQFDGNAVAAGIDLQGIQCDLEEYIDDYTDGSSEGKRFFDLFAGNLTLGMKLLCMAAENGSAKLQTFLGACYESGRGIEANPTEAMKWYKRAATQGYAHAQNIVGNAYSDGVVVQKDLSTAVQWFKKAAEQGVAGAQLSLGLYYYGEADLDEARKWLLQAAEQGNSEAMCNLGLSYIGDYDEDKEAIKWFRKALEQGDKWTARWAKSELLDLISKAHRTSKIWGIIRKKTDAEIYGIQGHLVWDFIIYNEISFDDLDGNVRSLFTSISDKKTEVEWNRLVNKFGIK